MQQPASTNTLGSYPFWNALVSTALALVSIGVLALLALHINCATHIVRANLRLHIYLQHHITATQHQQLRTTLLQAPYVAKQDQGPAIKFVSKQAAAKQFVQATGEAFDQVLEDNPLRDMYTIALTRAYQTPQQLRRLKQRLSATPGVFEVTYVENIIHTIHRHFLRLGISLMLIGLLLCGAASLLIHNTLKLALYSQRFLLHSMQLVGADAHFIRAPYMRRAALIGFTAGALAINLLLLLLSYANKHYPDLARLQVPLHVFAVLLGTLLLGMWLCLFSTYRAINKYLATALDDLY